MTKSIPYIESFPPVSSPEARVLILGSMPGEASLAAGQYYAHPRNHFWPLMGDLVGAGATLSYEDRLTALVKRNIALWDVLAACRRAGSLDSAITDEQPNDFVGFFARHPGIETVFFNGGKAEHAFRKHVLPSLKVLPLQLFRLPSTSPANASWSYERKCAEWRKILDCL